LEEAENRVRADITAVEEIKDFWGRKRKMVVYKGHEKAKEGGIYSKGKLGGDGVTSRD